MENKNMTSIEWFVEQLPVRIINMYHKEIEQAKQMNEQQIAEAYRTGVEEDVYNNPLRTGEEYYNEQYGK
jgi:hypothetical protein